MSLPATALPSPSPATNGVAAAPPQTNPPTPVPTNAVFGKDSGDGGARFIAPTIVAIIGTVWSYNALTPISTTGATAAPPDTATALLTVFLHPSVEARYVVVLLVGIFLYTAVAVWGDVVTRRQEQETLKKVRDAILPTAGGASTRDALGTALANESRNSLLVQAVQSVWDARNMATPDLEAISASLDALEAKRGNTGVGVGNRIMLLSLLGTILGLAQVISTLDPQIKTASATGDVDAIFKNLSGTLQQMGTAFSSTAWGIALSVLLSWITSGASAARQSYAAQVQYFAVSELAPRVLTSSPAAAINNLQSAIVQGERFLDSTAITLRDVAAGQSRMLQRLEAAHQAIEQGTTSFVTKVEDVFVKNATQFATNMQTVGDGVIAGAQAQINVAEQLDALLRESTAEMADAANSLRGAATVVQTLDNTVAKVDASANRMSADLTNVAPQLQSLLAAQANVLAQTGQANANTLAAAGAQQAQGWTDRMNRQENAFAQSLATMQKGLTAVTADLQTLVSAVQPRLPSAAELDKLRVALDGVTQAASALSRGGSANAPSGGSAASGGATPAQMREAMRDAIEPVVRELQQNRPGSVSVDDNRELAEQIGQTNQQIYSLVKEIRVLTGKLDAMGSTPARQPFPPLDDTYPPATPQTAYNSPTQTSYPPPDMWVAPEPEPTAWRKILRVFGIGR